MIKAPFGIVWTLVGAALPFLTSSLTRPHVDAPASGFPWSRGCWETRTPALVRNHARRPTRCRALLIATAGYSGPRPRFARTPSVRRIARLPAPAPGCPTDDWVSAGRSACCLVTRVAAPRRGCRAKVAAVVALHGLAGLAAAEIQGWTRVCGRIRPGGPRVGAGGGAGGCGSR